MKGTSTFCPLT